MNNELNLDIKMCFSNNDTEWVKGYGTSNQDNSLSYLFPIEILLDIDNKRVKNYFFEKDTKLKQNYVEDFPFFLAYLLEIIKFIPINIPCKYSNEFIEFDAKMLNRNEFRLDISHNWLENEPSFQNLTISYAQFKEEALKVIKKFIDFLNSFQNPLLFNYENFSFIKLGYDLASANFFESFPNHTIEQLNEEKGSKNPVIKELAERRLKQLDTLSN